MAKCPMCKKDISEAANICPHCKCDINKYYADIKREKERIAAEKAENARRAAEEKKKAEELADRLICPDCGTKVTLEDENCPKCGFPLNDKGERERMKMWRDIQSEGIIVPFAVIIPIIFGLVAGFIAYVYISETCDFFDADSDSVYRNIKIASIIVGFVATIFAAWRSIGYCKAKKGDNFEYFMLKHRLKGSRWFADMIKKGMAHCPYCQRRMTQKSIWHYREISKYYEIRCEHCNKEIKVTIEEWHSAAEEENHDRSVRRARRWSKWF